MSSASIAMNPTFNEGVRLSTKGEVLEKINGERDNIVAELRNKMRLTKFQLLKQYLVNEKIFIPEKIKTVEKLLKYVKKSLSKEQYVIVLQKKKSIDKSVEGMLEDLSKGSSTAFSVRMKQILKTVKNVGITIAKPLALHTILAIITPPPLQLFTGIGVLAHSGYKIVKSFKAEKVANKEYALSKMIRDMEITKHNDGKIIDTRFNSSIQELIRNFLKENKIEFQDTGYMSLMNAVYSLSFENKLKICNLINNNIGNPIDIKEGLKKYRSSFTEKLSTAFAPVTQMTGVGLDIADTINDAAVLRNMASSGFLGVATFLTTKSEELALVAAGGNATAGLLSSVTGWGADFVKGYQSLINKGGFALLFGLIGLTGSVALSLWNYVKGKKARIENAFDNKKISELDEQLYSEELKKEKELIKQKMLENPDLAKVMIISLVCEYMNEKGIEIPKNIKTVSELVAYINSLDKDKNRDIVKFYNDLMYYNTHNHGSFMKLVRKTISTAFDVATLGLAGMSLYDLFVNPDFLENLGDKVTGQFYETISTEATSVVETIAENSPVDLPINSVTLRINVVESAPTCVGSVVDVADASSFNPVLVASEINNYEAPEIYVQLTRAAMYDNMVNFDPIHGYASETSFGYIYNALTPQKLLEVSNYCNDLNAGVVTIDFNGFPASGSYISWNDIVCERFNGFSRIKYPTVEEAMVDTINTVLPNEQLAVDDLPDYLTDVGARLSPIVPPIQTLTGVQTLREEQHKKAPQGDFIRHENRDDVLHRLNNMPVNLEEIEQTYAERTR